MQTLEPEFKSITHCITLAKLFIISVLQFSQLQYGDSNKCLPHTEMLRVILYRLVLRFNRFNMWKGLKTMSCPE